MTDRYIAPHYAFTTSDEVDRVPLTSLELSRLLRRAIITRYQEVVGPGERLPKELTGHKVDGAPLDLNEPRYTYGYDPSARVFFVLPPRESPAPLAIRETLDVALGGLSALTTHRGVQLPTLACDLPEDLRASSVEWEAVTPYVVNRHGRGKDAHRALREDILRSAATHKLPTPEVRVLKARGHKGVGLHGYARLVFPSPINGPLLLGRTRYQGGGLYRAISKARK